MPIETASLPSALRDWKEVKRPYGVDASNDVRYRHFFVRDFQVAREHTQTYDFETALRGLDHAKELQATQDNPLSEARPGRYPHEHATTSDSTPDMNIRIQLLAADWGGTEDELLYYGSEDATPLTIIGDCQFYLEHGKRYKEKFGHDYWDGQIKDRDGNMTTRREYTFRALDHLNSRIDVPAEGFESIGLLGYKRINPLGHNNQVWMDSPASYMRTNGELPNYEGPIYAIELQAYAYDAYRYAIDMFGEREPELARMWEARAQKIQQETLKQFWMEDEKFFAMGLDHDPQTGEVRPIEVHSINAAELLKSRMFDDLSPEEQEYYIGNTIKRLMSDSFLTPAGLRCRDLKQKTPISYTGYHNEFEVWIKASHNVARTARKLGFHEVENELGRRHVNCVNIAGVNIENLFVDALGRPDYDPKGNRSDITGSITPVDVPVESIPDAQQTWTISSMSDIKRENARQFRIKQYQKWMRTRNPEELRQTLAALPFKLRPLWDEASQTLHDDNRAEWVKDLDTVDNPTPLLKTKVEIANAFPTDYVFRLDPIKGAEERKKVLEEIYGEQKTAAHSF